MIQNNKSTKINNQVVYPYLLKELIKIAHNYGLDFL